MLSIQKKSIFVTKPIVIVLFFLFILYFMFGLFGYGNDNDTYSMIIVGRNLWLTGVIDFSRSPGYFIPEVIIGGASLVGGSILTNLISSILGTATLYIFWQLLKKVFSDSNALLTTMIIGFNPYFVIASSSSMDYVYSLFFCMTGILLLTKRNIFVASLLFAFAASSRLSSILLIGIIYLYYFYIRFKENNFKEITRLFLSGCLVVLLTILLFVPSFITSGYTFGFFGYNIGDWTFFGHLSRFIYKNIYLFGILPFMVIGAVIILKIVKSSLNIQFTPQIYTGLAIILVSEILFFKIPCEISYLLPLLFVLLPLFVHFCQPRKIAMYSILVLTILYSFLINPDFLDRKYEFDDTGYEAISADVGLFMRRGIVIDDVMRREKSQHKYLPELPDETH